MSMLVLVLISAAVTYAVARQCCSRKPRRNVAPELVRDSADL